MNQQFLQVWCVLLLVAFSTTLTSGENNVAQPPPTGVVSTSSSQHQDNVAQYVAGVGPYNPPSGYQYTEPNYGPQSYDNYLVPYPAQAQDDDDTSLSTFQYFTSVMPYTRVSTYHPFLSCPFLSICIETHFQCPHPILYPSSLLVSHYYMSCQT